MEPSGGLRPPQDEEPCVVERLDTWLSVVANLGVVVGIFFLVVEIRQNTEALRAETHLAMFQGAQQELFVTIEHPRIVSIAADPETPATFDDLARLDSFLTAAMNARQYAWRQYRAGVLDEEAWIAETNIIALLVGSERNREWWRNLGRVQFAAAFAAEVDELVDDAAVHPYWIAMQALQGRPPAAEADTPTLDQDSAADADRAESPTPDYRGSP
jgi:hypothetical protein